MRILIMLQGDITRDQRVAKEIGALTASGYRVTLLEVSPPEKPDSESPSPAHVLHQIRLRTRPLPKNSFFWPLKYLEMVIQLFLVGRKEKADVVHAVDRLTLLPAYLVAKVLNARLVYDSKEIFPGLKGARNYPRWFWTWLEGTLSRQASVVLVTDHFRKEITQDLLSLPPEKVHVLMNLPRGQDLHGTMRNLRSDANLSSTDHLMVYAGILGPDRGLEVTIQAYRYLGTDHHLALVGFGGEAFVSGLRDLVAKEALGERIHFLDPVRWNEVVSYISSADGAFVFYPKNTLNNTYCSPSKLFDALLAGVPVVGTDNPLIQEILETHRVGVCLQEISPEAVAAAVQALLGREHVMEMRDRAGKLAQERYTWESQEGEFLEIYGKLGPKIPAG